MKDFSLTIEKEKKIQKLAYIPEHIISLMKIISQGIPGIINGFIFFVKDKILLFIGYPLRGIIKEDEVDIIGAINKLKRIYGPESIFMIAPEIPLEIKQNAKEFLKDYYYTLKVDEFNPPRRLIREVEQASKKLKVEIGKEFTLKHKALIEEFLKTKTLHPLVEALYNSMEGYFKRSDTGIILSALTEKEEIAAFFWVDYGAYNFLAYILGCHSKTNYVSHASDLLFINLVEMAKNMNKKEINLGLGINEGLRRFKEKWGGKPTIPYEFIEWEIKPPIHGFFKALQLRL